MKTRLKPKIKVRAFIRVSKFFFLPDFSNSSTLCPPAMKATKAGIIGYVHGIRKLASPARKEGIIRLKSIDNNFNND